MFKENLSGLSKDIVLVHAFKVTPKFNSVFTLLHVQLIIMVQIVSVESIDLLDQGNNSVTISLNFVQVKIQLVEDLHVLWVVMLDVHVGNFLKTGLEEEDVPLFVGLDEHLFEEIQFSLL